MAAWDGEMIYMVIVDLLLLFLRIPCLDTFLFGMVAIILYQPIYFPS